LGNDLSRGFSVHFLIDIDIPLIAGGPPCELFSVAIREFACLSVSIDRGTITAALDDGDLTYHVTLFPKVGAGFRHLTMAYVPDDTALRIMNWLDRKLVTNASLANIPFGPSAVVLTVGGRPTPGGSDVRCALRAACGFRSVHVRADSSPDRRADRSAGGRGAPGCVHAVIRSSGSP
jgi:hypothetical protein